MKKNFQFVLILLIVLFHVAPSFANQLHFIDDANYLSRIEGERLNQKLEEISAKNDVDVVILTVSNLEKQTASDYADTYYEEKNFKKDGILLLISRGSRDFAISTSGFGIKAFTDKGLNILMEPVLKALKQDKYDEAFQLFAKGADEFLSSAKEGNILYSRAENKASSTNILIQLVISLGIGLMGAYLITREEKKALTTVSSQVGAMSYLLNESVAIPVQNELFLYHLVQKTPKVKTDNESSTHRSASGTFHGGTSGKF